MWHTKDVQPCCTKCLQINTQKNGQRMCVSYLLLHNQLPPNLVASSLSYLLACVNQESRHDFIESSFSQSPTKLRWRCRLELHSPQAWLGKDPLPSSLTWLLMQFYSSKVIGLRASGPLGLLARRHAQFLAMGFSTEQLKLWQLASSDWRRARNRERVVTRQECS